MSDYFTADFQDFRAGNAVQPFSQDGRFTVVVYQDLDNPRVWRARIAGAARTLGTAAFNPFVAKLRVESYFRQRLTPWNRGV